MKKNVLLTAGLFHPNALVFSKGLVIACQIDRQAPPAQHRTAVSHVARVNNCLLPPSTKKNMRKTSQAQEG